MTQDTPVARSRLSEHLASGGSLPFAEFMQAALYGPDGFYQRDGTAGRRTGDFITSVECGPLFGAVIGRWLDELWRAKGQPDEFRVIEAAAGPGTLWRTVRASDPACASSLHWDLVEVSNTQRDHHRELVGPRCRSLSALPDERAHVVLANELLDNIAFDIAEFDGRAWRELVVVAGSKPDEYEFLVDTPLSSAEVDCIARLVPHPTVGDRIPVPRRAQHWLDQARGRADRVVCFDYGAPLAALADRPNMGWLRTFQRHQRGHNPLAEIGSWDITSDVPIDWFTPSARVVSQAEWLESNGIDDLVVAARATWAVRAGIGDLAAMRARSAVNEAAALTDPTGLGAFWVLDWAT